MIDGFARSGGAGMPVRLNTLLADGTDQLAAKFALALGWTLSVQLPFGRTLNRTIVSAPATAEEARSLLAGDGTHNAQLAKRFAAMAAIEDRARILEIAERDATIADLLVRHLEHPDDHTVASAYLFETAQRFAIGGRILAEQSDLIVAVWDGRTVANVGGTGDTVRCALREGIPVLRIDPAQPGEWCLLSSTEDLLTIPPTCDSDLGERQLKRIVEDSTGVREADAFAELSALPWRDSSSVVHHAYRRIESLFGFTLWSERLSPIRQRYERPSAIAAGSGAALVDAVAALGPGGGEISRRIADLVLPRMAWSDGIATALSDRYRSGMVVNFLLGAIAIVVGVLYLPLGGPEKKWVFAAGELVLLLAVVINTIRGTRRRLHERWFAVRRVAEYLRQRPFMLASGVARPTGQWPHGEAAAWPEVYARLTARETGIPTAVIDGAWLRGILLAMRDLQVIPQRDYHLAKANRLERVHHALDRASEWLFVLAIVSVSAYLALAGMQAAGWLDGVDLARLGKWFTVAGVAFPTVGGAFAGIRYFGDFERFADISSVTARRLEEISRRIAILEALPQTALRYQDVAELVRETDATVMNELASWQAVFSGKRIAIPV